MKKINKRFAIAVSFALLVSASLAPYALAQQRVGSPVTQAPLQSAQPNQIPQGQGLYGGYFIGVGDIVNIRIAEEDDVSGRYQVSSSGDVQLPLLSKPVHAAGLTTFDFSKKLAEQLKLQQILKEPYVTVFIERGMTQNVSINGPVARPGIYPIEKPTRLMDVISMSGGLLPSAGQTITVIRPPADSTSTGSANAKAGGSQSVQVASLMSGDAKDDLEIHAGDQISVAGASIVYVVGAVTHPGAFAIEDQKTGMTVLRAIAMVEGTLSTASLKKTIIVRKSDSDSGREEIPLDLNSIMKGKAKDPVLLANDILFVPQSGFKQGMQKMGEVAATAASQMTGYGLGLRIAP